MKKILGLAMVLVFLFSLIPAVMAENNGNQVQSATGVEDAEPVLISAEDTTAAEEAEPVLISAEEAEDTSDLTLRERLKRAKEKRLEKFEELKESERFRKFNTRTLKARELVKDRIQKARENYQAAKERYTKFLRFQKDKREKFQEVKEKLQACKEDSEDCEGLRTEIKGASIEYLANSLDLVMSELEKIKAKIEESETMTDEEAETALERIEEKISEVEELQEKVDALTEDSTKEEIQEVAKEIRGMWQDLNHAINLHAGKVINARIGGIIVKSKQLETKLDRILERMAEEDRDTSNVENLVEEFHSQLEIAKDYYESAVQAFEDGDVQIGQDYMRQAHNSLKEAHRALKQIFKELRDQAVSVEE